MSAAPLRRPCSAEPLDKHPASRDKESMPSKPSADAAVPPDPSETPPRWVTWARVLGSALLATAAALLSWAGLEPLFPEYCPPWTRRLLGAVVLLGLASMALDVAVSWFFARAQSDREALEPVEESDSPPSAR